MLRVAAQDKLSLISARSSVYGEDAKGNVGLVFDDIDIGAIEFAAVKLSNYSSFEGPSRDYREAVEALVQYELINRITTEGIRLGIVSRVTLNGYTKLKYVTEEANSVSASLTTWLLDLR